MVFNARGHGITTVTGAVAPAVLKLSKAAYCGIFNGTLRNWNAPAFKSLNSNTPLFDTTNDTAVRWAADGAPIRLVGRLDRSGTTDIFARHLAAVCNTTSAPGVAALGTNPGVPAFTGLNKFLQAAETLPYATSTGVDFRSVRGDVNYRVNASASSLAGTTNSISGDYWNGTAILNIGAGSVAFPSTAGSTSMPTGNVGSGLFLLADGSARVATGIASAPDYALNGVLLNGKIGYISSDFINPSVDAPGGLQAATLQVGVSPTLYANPTPSAARTALATILPPQSDTQGLFVATDTRMVRPTSGAALVSATRANPIAWTDVLYSDPTGSLAAPALGYPITGTTQFLGYTCYNGGNREAMVNHLATVLGQIGKNSTGGALSRGVFSAVTPGAEGIDVQSLLGVVPTSWARAITNTFLSNSTDAGALNLWIQSAVTPAYQNVNNPSTGLPYVPARPNIRTATTANSTCTGLPGA
jgi:ABC-type phosphate transport system substrate-binding protein